MSDDETVASVSKRKRNVCRISSDDEASAADYTAD